MAKNKGNMTDNKYLFNQSIISGKCKEGIALNIPLYPDNIDSCSLEKKFLVIENPLQGIWMGGKMNENKRKNLIVPITEQMSIKKWPMCIYDHHYPQLADKLQFFDPKTIFHIVNLNDAMYSDRVDILKYMETISDTWNMAETIVKIMNQGQKSFFHKSIVKFMTACIWLFLREQGNKHYCLPHVLAFIMEDYKSIFRILMNNKDCAGFLEPFQAAYKSQDYEQIDGMLSGFRVKLSQLCTPQNFWITSKEDFSLYIRKKTFREQEILLIATTPETEENKGNTAVLGALLLNTFLSVNSWETENKVPIGVVVDDLENVYIQDFDRLLGTMRYNKISMALGFQTERHLKRYYDEKVMNILFPIIPTFLNTSIQHTGTQAWLRRLGVTDRNKDIPEDYVYCSKRRNDALVKVNTAETSKGVSPENAPHFTDEDEMNKVLKENYDRIVNEEKDFCKNRLCSNKWDK